VLGFAARRLAQCAAVVLIATTLTFCLVHLAPGDPFSGSIDNPLVTEAVRARWRAAYGLDRPLVEQYWLYLASVARGEFGWSFSLRRPVWDALRDALPNTLLLMGAALALSFALGIALGALQGARRGTRLDRTLRAGSLLFHSLPDFWLALMAMLAFAYWLPLFPVTGMVDPVLHDYMGPWARLVDRARHLTLPVTTLTLLTTAVVMRFQRAAVLDVAGEDFVRTARAKGVDERAVLRRHVLRNALLPTLTLIGLAFPALLGGAVFVERVFGWPGMGTLAVNAVMTRDYPLVTATVIVASTMVALGTLLADLCYAAADPRLRAR
jgi:peptide/nickel transport system permease protein